MTSQSVSPLGPARPGVLARLLRAREFSLVLLLLVVMLGTAAINPLFLSPGSLRDLFLNVSIIALIVVGQTIVLLMKHVDLSVSSVVGLSAFLSGSLLIAVPGLPLPLVLLFGLLLGGVLGAVNGALVAYGKVPALVATLGTLYVFRGVTYAVVSGGQINASNLPPAFLNFASGTLLGVPNLVLLVLAVLVAFGVYLRSYRGGREYYALGSNSEAAVLAGISVSRRTMTGFITSGAIAGLAGVLYLARYGTVEWEHINRDNAAIESRIRELMDAGVDPASTEAMDVAEAQRRHISYWFYEMDHDFHVQKSDLYVHDTRFRAGIEKNTRPGAAEWLQVAITANADRCR